MPRCQIMEPLLQPLQGKRKGGVGGGNSRSQRACCEVTSLGASSAEPQYTAAFGAAAQVLAESPSKQSITELLSWLLRVHRYG